MSTPTSSDLLARFPEFGGADTDLIDAAIADAVQRTNATAWGDLYTQGVLYMAAESLALSPYGRKMRLVSNEGETVYSRPLRTMKKRVSVGLGRVT